jgi:hypothetical protein
MEHSVSTKRRGASLTSRRSLVRARHRPLANHAVLAQWTPRGRGRVVSDVVSRRLWDLLDSDSPRFTRGRSLVRSQPRPLAIRVTERKRLGYAGHTCQECQQRASGADPGADLERCKLCNPGRAWVTIARSRRCRRMASGEASSGIRSQMRSAQELSDGSMRDGIRARRRMSPKWLVMPAEPTRTMPSSVPLS